MTDVTWDATPDPPVEGPIDAATIDGAAAGYVTTDAETGVTTVEIDADGDGVIDAMSYDFDGDGVADAMTADLDGDGIMESGAIDHDGDDIVDATSTMDPATGAWQVEMDTDGDGVSDTFMADTDGDGTVDVYETAWSDAPTQNDPTQIDPTQNDPTQIDPAEDVVAPSDSAWVTDPGMFVSADELPEGGDDGVWGDPREDIVYHTVQPGPVDCLPTSVSMVISELSGEYVPAQDVVDLAHEHGFMYSSGMSLEDSVTLLSDYGLDAEVVYGDVDDLRTALANGDEIIIGLDSSDLYNGTGGPFDSGMTAGHAVVLTGIEDGPPAYVYVNDPAFSDGAGVQVPLELFLDAWEDNDNGMVVVEGDGDDAGAERTVSAAEQSPAADGDSLISRFVLLPITLLFDPSEGLQIVGDDKGSLGDDDTGLGGRRSP